MWNGVVWGRLGRGDHAWAWWDGVDDPVLQPWIAAERGRVLREFGLHGAAEELEADGLRIADDLVDAVMLRLSLAADAVGLGELTVAQHRLEAATALLDELPEDERVQRQRLRAGWVGVELALTRGDRPSADGLPSRGSDGPVFPVDHDAGTDFHRAKGLLFAGIVREDATLLDMGAALAPPALRWAIELARHDAGKADALGRARSSWGRLVPPPPHETAVAATPTAARLRRD